MNYRYVLFCNDNYGRPYEIAFRTWCAQQGVSDYLVVKSARVRFYGHPLRAYGRRVLHRMRLAVTNHRFASQRVRFVENVNDEHSVNQLTGGVETVGLIAGFDQIFRPNTISRFSYFYNFHPSLLPYYRGPVPSHWCIANGEEFTGVTLHTVTGQIDAGAIIAQKVVKICTSDEHELDLAVAQSGAEILIELLDGLCKGVPLPHSQVLADRYYKVLVDYRSFPRPAAQ